MGRRGVRHEHEIGKLGDKRDRRKIRNRIVAQRAVETGVHRQRRGGEQDGVSVGIGPRDVFVADVGAGACLVLDDDLLAPHPRKLFGEHARDDIGRAPGRDRHNEAHGLIWEISFRRLRARLPNEEVGANACAADRAIKWRRVSMWYPRCPSRYLHSIPQPRPRKLAKGRARRRQPSEAGRPPPMPLRFRRSIFQSQALARKVGRLFGVMILFGRMILSGKSATFRDHALTPVSC